MNATHMSTIKVFKYKMLPIFSCSRRGAEGEKGQVAENVTWAADLDLTNRCLAYEVSEA